MRRKYFDWFILCINQVRLSRAFGINKFDSTLSIFSSAKNRFVQRNLLSWPRTRKLSIAIDVVKYLQTIERDACYPQRGFLTNKMFRGKRDFPSPIEGKSHRHSFSFSTHTTRPGGEKENFPFQLLGSFRRFTRLEEGNEWNIFPIEFI